MKNCYYPKSRIFVIIILLALNSSLISQPYIFEKVYDWSTNDITMDFTPTNDGGYALLSRIENNIYVLKLDSNGDSLWTFSFDSGWSSSWPSFNSMKIIQAVNNDLLVAGQFNQGGILLRLNSIGDSINSFVKYWNSYGSFMDVVELDSGDLIISSKYFYDIYDYPSYALHRFSQSGELIWERYFGTDPMSRITLTSDNEILLIRVSINYNGVSMNVEKRDLIGNQTMGNYLGKGGGIDIIESLGGDYYAAVQGYYQDESYYAMKLDTAGDPEWRIFNQFESYGFPRSICELKPNLFAICGETDYDLAIKTFNESGDSLSFFTYSKYSEQNAQRMSSDGENIVIAGGIEDSTENKSMLILKMPIDSLITSNNNLQIDKFVNRTVIYPNPAQNEVFVRSKERKEEVTIYNLQGQMVLHDGQPSISIDISSLESGIYIIEVITDDARIWEKLIIQ